MYLERNASAQSSPLGIYNPCSPACEGGAIFVSSLQRFPPSFCKIATDAATIRAILQRLLQGPLAAIFHLPISSYLCKCQTTSSTITCCLTTNYK